MTAIRDILVSFTGEPTTTLENSLLYAGVVILAIVVFDTVLGIFRVVAKLTTRL